MLRCGAGHSRSLIMGCEAKLKGAICFVAALDCKQVVAMLESESQRCGTAVGTLQNWLGMRVECVEVREAENTRMYLHGRLARCCVTSRASHQ